MKLELANFPVQQIVVGTATRWDKGVLEIDAAQIKKAVLADPAIGRVDIEIASPGDSTRIIHVRDAIEPKLKNSGYGVPYPGVFGRSTEISASNWSGATGM